MASVSTVSAVVFYSDFQNIEIPTNFAGVYLNVLNGATGTNDNFAAAAFAIDTEGFSNHKSTAWPCCLRLPHNLPSDLEMNLERMRFLDITMSAAHTLYSSEASLSELLPNVDLLVGAVLVPGSKAPKLVTPQSGACVT